MVFALLIGVLYATLPAAAQEPAGNSTDAPTVKQIASDLYFFYDYSGSNSVFLVTDEGVLVIDTGQHPRAGQALLERIRKITNKPIKWVINSHFHGDHTFGNAAFKTAGATFVTHKETARIMQLVQPPADVNPHRRHRPENPSPLVAYPHVEGKVRHPFFKGIREDLL